MKPITRTAKFFLVQKLTISNKDALTFISNGRLKINGIPASLNQKILDNDLVEFDEVILQKPSNKLYLAYHKPRGIETTLNKEIEGNLAEAIGDLDVYPVGRLDKESEGLLLLTNDGSIYNKIQHSDNFKEKEYEVVVNNPITSEFIDGLTLGVKILGTITRPAEVTQLSSNSFKIILTQGLNRQIRRMCYKFGYEVTKLKRIRIVNIQLKDLPMGKFRNLDKEELDTLLKEITSN